MSKFIQTLSALQSRTVKFPIRGGSRRGAYPPNGSISYRKHVLRNFLHDKDNSSTLGSPLFPIDFSTLVKFRFRLPEQCID